MRTCGCKTKTGSRCKRRGSSPCWQHRGVQHPSLWQRIVQNHTLAFCLILSHLTLAVFAFLRIDSNSVLTLLHSDPPTTASVAHPTFEELSKPNPLLEALRQPQPALGTIPARTEMGEPSSVLGTVSTIGPQLFEHSATDDFVNVAVHRAQDPPR